MKNILYPNLRFAWLPDMLILSVFGALVAGLYGVLHDQITYSISPEYFTRLKFTQFRYADCGFPRRVFVGEIGFLATWWVGFFSAWFVARITIPAFPRAVAFRYSFQAFMILIMGALAGAIVGYTMGILHGPDYSSWEGVGSLLGVSNLPEFVRVAYIHNAGYLGALLGLTAAILHLRNRRTRTHQTTDSDSGQQKP